MHYSSLFQYFFSIYCGPYSSWKFLIFSVLVIFACTILPSNIAYFIEALQNHAHFIKIHGNHSAAIFIGAYTQILLYYS